MKKLEKKKEAAVKPQTENLNQTMKIINALKEKYEFRYNMGNQKNEYKPLNASKFVDLTDKDVADIKVKLNVEGIICGKETVRDILDSRIWPQYDPYRELLNALPEWNGEDHIAALAATVHTEDDDYFGWCFKKWLVGFVGSLAEDDVVNQQALIFCGKQGIGKSSWFKNMLPKELRKYYSTGYMDPRDRETLVQLSELALYNMDEVENLKAKNVEAIKEIITKPSMYTRRAYRRDSQNYVRRCSFCGTANGTNILHDMTGNRRFLCQNVTGIDYMLNGINLQQVYAQAYHLFRNGFKYYFDKEDEKRIDEHNALFRSVSMEEELINSYFEPCNDGEESAIRLQAHEILSELQGVVPHHKLYANTLGKALNAMGFVNKKSCGISKWLVRRKSKLVEKDTSNDE